MRLVNTPKKSTEYYTTGCGDNSGCVVNCGCEVSCNYGACGMACVTACNVG